MRNWILGLLCLAFAVFAAARYQNLRAEDIDAELEALENAVRAREQAAHEKRSFDLDDLEGLSDEEILLILSQLDDSSDEDKRDLGEEIARKRGWGWRAPRVTLPRIRIPTPRIPTPRIPTPRIPWGKR